MFYMFRMDTARNVAGSFDQSLWTKDILRAAGQYPAVWYANLALAAIHRWKIMSDSDSLHPASNQYLVASINHYQTAIRHLQHITRKPTIDYTDKETMLISEILFIGFNSLSGHLKEATVHANNAVQLFSRWQFWKSDCESQTPPSNAVLRKQSLVMLVTNFEVQFVNRLGHIPQPRWQDGELPTICSDTPFKTIDDAYAEWMPLYAGIIVSGRDVGELPTDTMMPVPDTFWFYRKETLAWANKFQKFRESVILTNENDKNRAKLLELYAFAMRACINSDITEGIYLFDRHTDTFNAVLKTLEEMQQSRLTYGNAPFTRTNFSFSISVCELFWWITISCRQHDFRVRAIALLREWPVCDGLWDSRLIASVLEACMNIEDEGGLAQLHMAPPRRCRCTYRSFICGEHRLRTKWVQFVRDGEALLHFSTVKDSKEGRPTQTKQIFY